MLALLVDVSENVAQRQLSFLCNLLEALPEFVLNRDARLTRTNLSCPLSNW
jgi:hypothetical protein